MEGLFFAIGFLLGGVVGEMCIRDRLIGFPRLHKVYDLPGIWDGNLQDGLSAHDPASHALLCHITLHRTETLSPFAVQPQLSGRNNTVFSRKFSCRSAR